MAINFPLWCSFAASHRFWKVGFSLSYILKYFLISSLNFLLTLCCCCCCWFFSSMLFSHHVFVLLTFFLPVTDFWFHSAVVRKNALYNFYSKLLRLILWYLPCNLTWTSFHMHLKKMCTLLFLDGMSCRNLLRPTNLIWADWFQLLWP